MISNETNYDPYEQVSAVSGSIMWAQNETHIPADSADSTGALLGYVSLLSLHPPPPHTHTALISNETNMIRMNKCQLLMVL